MTLDTSAGYVYNHPRLCVTEHVSEAEWFYQIPGQYITGTIPFTTKLLEMLAFTDLDLRTPGLAAQLTLFLTSYPWRSGGPV